MPSSEIIEKSQKIYYGSHEAMYGDRFAYSVLYKYNGKTPYFYYKILFVPDGDTDSGDADNNFDRSGATHIDVYRCMNGAYNNLVLVRRIQLQKKGVFDEEKYWQENYKTLLHLQ